MQYQLIDSQKKKYFLCKQWAQIKSVKRKLKAICKANKGEEIAIITHCIYLQSAKPSFEIRKKYGAKVYTIVPDLPEHSTSVGFNGHSFLKKIFGMYLNMSQKFNKEFDGYICFAEPQMEHLNKEKPHIVMEGFIDTTLIDSIDKKEDCPNRIIYAGGLMYRYGIKELVDGFIKAAIPDAELYIYGKGEAEEYILGKEDKGVYYGGCLSREEVIAQEKGAFILVNPRPTDDEYSKCSFPSKLMEYMARHHDDLLKTMTDEQKELFSRYTDALREHQAITERMLFQSSFKLGARKLHAGYL